MPDKYESFVNIFLRLNGYFTVPSFIVHAADDPNRISNDGKISSHTEVDSIGVRMPHSREQSGIKAVENYAPLVNGSEGLYDCVLAEVKSGKGNTANKAWKPAAAGPAIAYIVRFVGLHTEGDIAKVADGLSNTYLYAGEQCRYRYIVFAREANQHYAKLGVTYITFKDAIEFFVKVRGDSWVRAGIGDSSLHEQWDPVMQNLFAIANDFGRQDRAADIEAYLAS